MNEQYPTAGFQGKAIELTRKDGKFGYAGELTETDNASFKRYYKLFTVELEKGKTYRIESRPDDPKTFDATLKDGLAAAKTLQPPKSNWARAINKPPYLAYPLIGAIAYTFGGLTTNEKAEVLGERGPISGLYAAGETTGHFYGTAPNAVAVLRALVFGKIAGCEAVEFVAQKNSRET